MSAIWQEHRRFILSLVAGGMVVWIVAGLILGGIYDGRIGRYKRSITRSKRAQRGVLPPGVHLADVRKELQEEDRSYRKIEELMQRIPDAGFQLKGAGEDADLHYLKQIDLLRRKEVELCALKNIGVDQGLGLPMIFPTDRRDKDWYLRGLDMVRQLLLMVLDTDQFMEGGITRVDAIKIGKRPVLKGRLKATFFDLLPLSMSILGHPQAINHLLRDLPLKAGGEGPKGRFLSVVEAKVVSLDEPPGGRRRSRKGYRDPADHNRVRLDLKVAAVTIKDAKEEQP